MKKYTLLFLVALVSMLVVYSCQHKNTPEPNNTNNNSSTGGNGSGNNGNNNPTDTSLCFERDILPIFIANCTESGCHDAISRQEGYQFTDYNSIVSKDFVAGNADATELYEKITEDKADKIMPPPPNTPLSAQQIALIRRWINEGAKNTTNCSVNCDTNTFTYSGAVSKIVTKYCTGCHSGAAAPKGIQLDNYNGVQAVAANGQLLGAVRHDAGYTPMPQGGNKLSDCEIRQIEKWIATGMQNN